LFKNNDKTNIIELPKISLVAMMSGEGEGEGGRVVEGVSCLLHDAHLGKIPSF
jgi:hypothetical protein